MNLDFVIKMFGGMSVLLLAVGWLCRSIILHFLSKDVENFKRKIQAESETEIIKLKANLEKSATEHHILFSKFHENRAEVLREMYSLVSEFYEEAVDFLKPSNSIREGVQDLKLKKIIDTNIRIRNYFNKNRIIISKSTCERIQKFIENTSSAVSKLVFFQKVPEDQINYSEMTKVWLESWDKLEGIVLDLRKEIEDDFRSELGDDFRNIKNIVNT